jgi:hypothetical protein
VKRNRGESKREPKTIQVWTHEQATQVLPYVASIMSSLRESQLEAIRYDLKAKRLWEREGRLSRRELIAHEETVAAANQAEQAVYAALEELHELDIYCLDPVQGLALIPFAVGDDLAWYVFDLFDPKTLRYWRYHKDPIETRRSITGTSIQPAGDNSVVI